MKTKKLYNEASMSMRFFVAIFLNVIPNNMQIVKSNFKLLCLASSLRLLTYEVVGNSQLIVVWTMKNFVSCN